MPKPWKHLHLRFIDPPADGGGGAPAPNPAPAAPAAPAASAAPAATEPPAQEEPNWKAKYEEAISHSRTWEQRAKENYEKAQKFDASEAEKLTEIEKATLRATTAEQAAATNSAELLQLKAAIEHGITKDERALLTGTTEEQLQKQVDAVLKLRAPATASAQAAGITGGGPAPTSKPTSMEAAFTAHYAAKSN